MGRLERLLVVYRKSFDGVLFGKTESSSAVFAMYGSEWRCCRATPELSWFKHVPLEEVMRWLHSTARSSGWTYRWASRFEL